MLPQAPEIMRGVTFGFYAKPGYFDSRAAREEVDAMVDTGVSWVVVTPIVMQESPNSPRMFADFEQTPSDFEIGDIIDYIHGKGLKVQLRPMIENWSGHGRLQIDFPYDTDGGRIPGLRSDLWQRWFRSMRARTRHYATIAKRLGCEMYGLDSEIDRFVHMDKDWGAVVEVAREAFGGHITSCHTHQVDFHKELERETCWFRQLDSLGTSFYNRSGAAAGADKQEMRDTLRPWVEYYRHMAAALGKPVYFGECGARSAAGTCTAPSGWAGQGGYDGDEQARHFETIMELFWDEPWWGGLYWWKWDEQNARPHFTDDHGRDLGFTIRGKPIQDSMRHWFSKTGRKDVQ